MPEETVKGTYYVESDEDHPLHYVLLNPAQIEQVRAIVREEIAEAMKQLLNEPAKKLVHEIEMYPEQDSFE